MAWLFQWSNSILQLLCDSYTHINNLLSINVQRSECEMCYCEMDGIYLLMIVIYDWICSQWSADDITQTYSALRQNNN